MTEAARVSISLQILVTIFLLALLSDFGFVRYVHGLPLVSDKPTHNKLEQNSNLFEGDMLLPTAKTLEGRALIARGSGVTWPNGIVPYEIAPGYTYEQESTIIAAMRMLENAVAVNNFRCVQFRPRVPSDQYYIIIVNGEGCSSYVGQNAGLPINRTVTLQSSGCLGYGTIMHELLHTLGFMHEQSRPDRDSFVRINWANIPSDVQYNFEKYDTIRSDTYNTTYDYGSLMHYGPTAFSTNGLPTIEPLQAGVTIGQRNSLSPTDIHAVQVLYNCTSSGITLPPPTLPTTINFAATNTTYTSALITSSPTFSRADGGPGQFYYGLVQVNVSTAGYYRFRSSSALDTYCYLYQYHFYPTSPSTYLLGQDDDSGGLSQCQLTLYLAPNTVYYFVVTTYSPATTGTYSVVASGLTNVQLIPINGVNTTVTVTSTPTGLPATTPRTGITSNYSSALTRNSSQFTRRGGSGTFYYEAIRITVNTSGNYTIRSNSLIDAYGYLYANNFDVSNVGANLITYDDDSGGSYQFSITSSCQAGAIYILVFTTYSPNVMALFSITVLGPAPVSLVRLTLSPVTTTPPTPSNTTNITTTYSGALNANSSQFTRTGGAGVFYFEAARITVNMSGSYTIRSNSLIDTFGYLYANSFNASNVRVNLMTYDDDSGGNNQFLITSSCQAGAIYVLVCTTYSPNVMAPFSITVVGPAPVSLVRISPAPPITPPQQTTNFPSVLTANSSRFTRSGATGSFYYAAIQITSTTPGTYTLRSNSSMDAFGYLYINSFNPLSPGTNLAALDDDSGGSTQFLMAYSLQVGTVYILVFTTYSPGVIGSYTLSVSGPGRVDLSIISDSTAVTSTITNASAFTSIAPSTTTVTPVTCNGSSNAFTCPVSVTTHGTVVSMNPDNRVTNGGFIGPNSIAFNQNDSSTVSGYVQSVTVQFASNGLPSQSATIGIYGIIPIPGSYIVCSQYLIPSSQTSSLQQVQTYIIPSNTINLFNGAYVGIGIQDSSASIATVSGTVALQTGYINLASINSTRTLLYVQPNSAGYGIKFGYTIMT